MGKSPNKRKKLNVHDHPNWPIRCSRNELIIKYNHMLNGKHVGKQLPRNTSIRYRAEHLDVLVSTIVFCLCLWSCTTLHALYFLSNPLCLIYSRCVSLGARLGLYFFQKQQPAVAKHAWDLWESTENSKVTQVTILRGFVTKSKSFSHTSSHLINCSSRTI